MKAKILALALSLGLFALGANAQSSERHPVKRHEVHKSIRKGDLNRREVAHLGRQQHRINRTHRMAMRDGHIGPMERHRLHHMKAKQRRHYYVMKHNGRRRMS